MNRKVLSLYGLKWNPSGPDVPVEVIPWPAGQPVVDHHGGLMRPVVVQHQVHVQCCRHRLVDDPQELPELRRAMPPVALANHLPGGGIQRRKQRGRSVPTVSSKEGIEPLRRSISPGAVSIDSIWALESAPG